MDEVEWSRFKIKFDQVTHDLDMHMRNVEDYLVRHPKLAFETTGKVHSSRSRLKNSDHLREKIERKNAEYGGTITPENVFHKITDLAGVRLLLLFQQDFSDVHDIITKRVSEGYWFLHERPVANTWDPEAEKYFSQFDLDIKKRETYYTSVHYLIRPTEKSPLCCELQVRTLFEEIWREVDHRINYPQKTEKLACREQLLVLSKLVGAGSRLLDSIRRTMEE